MLYYSCFYSFLYGAAVAFLLFALLTVVGERTSHAQPCSSQSERPTSFGTTATAMQRTTTFPPTAESSIGNFYLRMGALVFGLGAMIYAGLQCGQFAELSGFRDLEALYRSCTSPLALATPAAHFIFVFIQTYYIFLNGRVSCAGKENR